MRAGSIRVELELEDGNFVTRVMRAGDSLRTFEQRLGQTVVGVSRLDTAHLSLGRSIRDITMTLGLASQALHTLHAATTGVLANIVKTNAEMERMTTLMKGMSGIADPTAAWKDAQKNVGEIIKMTEQAPFSLKAMTDAFVKFKSAGIDPTSGAMRSLVNSVAAFGGTEDQLHRASIAVQQMAGKGVISMEELRQQLGEAVPSAFRLMAASVGMSMADFSKAVATGRVQAEGALQRMFLEMELVYGGAAQQMMTTFNGILSQTATAWIKVQTAIGGTQSWQDADKGFFAAVKNQLMDINQILNSGSAMRYGDAIGRDLANLVAGLRQTAEWAVRNKNEILGVGQALLIAFGASKGIGLITALAAGFMGLSTNIRAVGAAISAQGAAWSLYAAQATTATGAVTAFGRAAGVAAGTATFLGRAISVLGGPIGVAIGLIGSLVVSLGWLETSAAKAERAWKSMKDGFANEEDMKRGTEDLVKREEQLVRLQKVKEKLEKGVSTGNAGLTGDLAKYNNLMPGLYGTDPGYKAAKQSIADDMLKLEADLADKRKTLLRSQTEAVETAAQREVRAVTQAVEERAAANRTAYDLARKEIEKGLTGADGKISDQDKYFEQRNALVKKHIHERIALYDAEAKKAGEALARITGNGSDDQVAREVQSRIIKRMTELKAAELQAEEGLLKFGSATPMGINDSKKPGMEANQFANALINLKGQVGGLRAELEGGEKALGTFNAKLEAGKWEAASRAGTITQAELDEYRKLASEKEKLEDALKDKKKGEAAFGQLSDDLEKVKIRYDDVKAALMDPNIVKFGNELSSITARTAQQLADIAKLGPEAAAEAKAKAGQVEQTAINALVANKALGWREKAAELNASFADSLEEQRELREKNVREQIQQIDYLVSRFKDGTEEEKKIAADAAAYKETLNKKLARDNEGAIDKMFRSWKDYSARMEEAGARWLDGFTDKLVDFAVTGKATFGDFAESVLRDILRMQYQASIASAITNAGGFGGIFGAIGDFFGFGDTPGPAVDTSNGFDPGALPPSSFDAAGNHAGGIVGLEATFLRQVPASLFTNAERFHTGRAPVLRPDEVPTILQKDEGVFTPAQMKALARGNGGMAVQINLINQSGQQVAAEQGQPRFDGEQMVLDIVLRAASRPGHFRDSMKGALS